MMLLFIFIIYVYMFSFILNIVHHVFGILIYLCVYIENIYVVKHII